MDESFSGQNPDLTIEPTLLSPGPSKKSIYWVHYLEYDPDVHPDKRGIARCKICGRDIKCNQGTGGIKKHLAYKHPKELTEIEAGAVAETLENAEAADVKDVLDHMTRNIPALPSGAPPKKKKKSSITMTAEDRRQHERHWMDMWMSTSRELTRLRGELKGETDEEVVQEIMVDIQGLKRKKVEFAKKLGMMIDEPPTTCLPHHEA